MPGAGDKRPISWHSIFAQLSRDYRWTPQDIGQLTLAQVWFYWNKDLQIGGVVSMRVHESQAFVASRKEAIRQAVDAILGTKDNGAETEP